MWPSSQDKKEGLRGHGQFLAWIWDNSEVLGFTSVRTADRLMRAAAKLNSRDQYDEIAALQISREMWGHLWTGTRHGRYGRI